ncbi:Profilin [Gracilariopsis chorda]|uniref:Profilin n=1 Tax=Gracilariopsis chorda TaxID=448386 RepID=A0A2V3IMA4_9FLOR|nr:Profilin [Gracilariopsis chorda]|eukprot:PXF43215.1 Profilin [Gracilariopsis chorda]
MASWQTYVDDQLMAAGCMYAAIYGHDGSKWASSPGFDISNEECEVLVEALVNSNLGKISGSGFTIATQKYTFTRGEVDDEEGNPSYAQGRCKEEGKSAQGVIIYATTQAFVIGVHDPQYADGASFGSVNTDAGRVADYLMELGF